MYQIYSEIQIYVHLILFKKFSFYRTRNRATSLYFVEKDEVL
jgi:hypothetical protein